MNRETALKLSQYCEEIAKANDIDASHIEQGKQFAAVPSVAQTLNQAVQESSAFLQKINVIGVDELKGEAIGLGAGNPIASRTDTTGTAERTAKDPTTLTPMPYELVQTNFDVRLTYAKLDQWAKFDNFASMWRAVIVKRMALDRIMIGWNGKSAAATTDPKTNPLLQDVNRGWTEGLKAARASNVVDFTAAFGQIGGTTATDKFKNLDAAVYDALNILPERVRGDSDLVVMISRDLLSKKYVGILNEIEQKLATEHNAIEKLLATLQLGGLNVDIVPYMPADQLAITSYDNLSIYYQSDKMRRTIKDMPEKNAVNDFNSSNEGYVIEDTEAMVALQNITFA